MAYYSVASLLKIHQSYPSDIEVMVSCNTIDVFSMSSCIATSRLVRDGGYVQKLLQLSNSPEIL